MNRRRSARGQGERGWGPREHKKRSGVAGWHARYQRTRTSQTNPRPSIPGPQGLYGVAFGGRDKKTLLGIVFSGGWGTPSARNQIVAIPMIAQGYTGRAKVVRREIAPAESIRNERPSCWSRSWPHAFRRAGRLALLQF